MQLSLDGVQESRSTSISLDVFSIKMKKCRNIYPLKIIRPINKFPISYRPHLKNILDSLKEFNTLLDAFIADNPKRSIVRECLCHSSNFACEYCTSKAVQYLHKLSEDREKMELEIKKIEERIKKMMEMPGSSSAIQQREEQIKALREIIRELRKKNAQNCKKQSHPVWPESTSKGEPRTKEGILSIVEAIEQHGRTQLAADEVKGVVGRSLLLEIEYFDFVLQVPVEYMHVGCLGVIKRKVCVVQHIF